MGIPDLRYCSRWLRLVRRYHGAPGSLRHGRAVFRALYDARPSGSLTYHGVLEDSAPARRLPSP